MRCVVAPRGTIECLYRTAYSCSDPIREIGLKLGHCVIERLSRDAERDEAQRFIEHLSTHARDQARDLVELWLDAKLYVNRATTWAGILWNRPLEEGGADMGEEEHLRALARYRMAGTNRLYRRFTQLQPFMDDARENQRTGRFDRLHRIANEAKREAAMRSKSA